MGSTEFASPLRCPWGRTSEVGRFSDWWVKTAVVSPDGNTLAIGADGVRMWSLKEGKLRHEQTLPGTSWAVSAIAFSPDGRRLIAGTGSSHLDPKDGQLLVWSLGKSPKVIARAAVAKGDVTGIVVRRDGRMITGDQTGLQKMLLQKRDGRFYLALWTNAASFNLTSLADIGLVGRNITVRFDTPMRKVQQYRPNVSASPTNAVTNVTAVNLTVDDRVLLVEITK